jgi:hypothetical protein
LACNNIVAPRSGKRTIKISSDGNFGKAGIKTA